MSDSAERQASDLIASALQVKEVMLSPSKAQSEQMAKGELSEVQARANNLAESFEIVLDKIREKTPSPSGG